MLLLALTLACVPPDPPVHAFVDVPPAPPRDLPIQTERQAFALVQQTLAAAGIPAVDAAQLGMTDRVPWSASEGQAVLTRTFLSGPKAARAHLAELGLPDTALQRPDLWDAYQALSLGSLAFELSRIASRERQAVGATDPAVDDARAAAVEQATLRALVHQGQIPASWPEQATSLICAMRALPVAAEIGAETRCAAADAAPVPLSALEERFATAKIDPLDGLLVPDPKQAGRLVMAVPEGADPLDLTGTRDDDGITLSSSDGSLRLRLTRAQSPTALVGVATLPLTLTAQTRPRALELVNGLNLTLADQGVRATLGPDGLSLSHADWEVVADHGAAELVGQLRKLALATRVTLGPVLAGADAISGAHAVRGALDTDAQESP